MPPISDDLIARGLGATDAELGLARPPIYRAFIRDATFQRVDQLSDWLTLEWVSRTNGVGNWLLELSADSVSAPLLTKTGGIILTREVEGIEKTIFSGFVWTEWSWTETTFRAAGLSDEALLQAPAYPTPSMAGPDVNNHFPDAYDVRTGTASTIMRQLVDLNIGPGAPLGRPERIPNLVMAADPLLGTSITSRANMDPIITLLAELAITPFASGLVFSLMQSDTVENSLEFAIRAPVDRSADAKFSIDLGTAQTYEDVSEAPGANRVLVMLGDGFGANRSVIAVQDDDSIAEWGRVITTVIDQRDVTDTSEGQQKAAESLAGVVTSRRATIVPFEVPSLQAGADYDQGDLVTIVTKGGSIIDLIREIQYSLDPERGATVTPMIGQAASTNDGRLTQLAFTLRDRIDNLQRNYNVPPRSIVNSMMTDEERWRAGDCRLTFRSSAADGWVFLQGQTVSRTTYATLFAIWGTTYGAGDGSTTFVLPDLRNRFPVGAGGTYSLGATGGGTANIQHSHTHSHGGGTLTRTHTHPQSHSHGIGSHVHAFDHSHDVNISAFDSGGENTFAAAFSTYPGVTTNVSHKHSIDPPNTTSGSPDHLNTGSGSGSTDPDTNVGAASWTSTWAGGTDSDSVLGGSTSLAIVPAYIATNIEVYWASA